MDNISRNCGKAQPAGEFATCHMCHKASEHVYCMKSKLSEVHAVWYCEECARRAPFESQNASKKLKTFGGSYFNSHINKSISKQTPPQAFSGRDHFKKSPPKTWSGNPGCIVDDTRKTMRDQKRISSKDGSTKIYANHKVAATSGSSNKQFVRTLSQGISYKEAKTSKTVLLEEGTQLKHGVRSGAHRISDASFHQIDQKNVPPPLTIGRASAKEYPAGSSRVTQVLSKSHTRSVSVDVHSYPSTCVTKGKNITPDKIETTQKIECLDSAGFRSPETMRVDIQEQNQPLVLAIDPDGKFLNGHVSQACWKGTFEVLDIINIPYSEIQAYFPHMVCSKVYEITRHLPEKLKFRLLPLRKLWPRIFQVDPPSKDDVGLYFFPCEEKRHKEKYVRFIERLQSRSLAMQTWVNGVHLLLFTSKQLRLESREIFMWGIFRNVKSKKHNQDEGIQSHVVDMRNKCSKLNVPCDEIVEEVDMEIDMIGGKEIGRIDIPIKKMGCSSGIPPVISKLEVGNPIPSDIPPGFGKHDLLKCPEPLTSEQQSLPKARSKEAGGQIYPDIPPGFAELGPPGFSQLRESKRQSLHVDPSKEAVSPIHPKVPSGFDELRHPGSLQIQAPKHESSSSFPSMDVICNLAARNGRDSVATAPEQSKHHQASDIGDKSAKHLGSCRHAHFIKDNKDLSSFDAAATYTKPHAMSPSTSTGQKGCRPTMNLCHQRPSISNEVSSASVAASKTSADGFFITTFCSGTPKEESNVDAVSMNASSYGKENGDADLRQTGHDKLVTREVKLVQECDPQSGGSKMRECNMLVPGEHVCCQHTQKNEKVQIERKGNSLDNQLALAYEDHKCTSGSPRKLPLTVQSGDSRVQRSRRVVSTNLAYDEDKQCTEKTQNHGVVCLESTGVHVSDSRSSISASPHSAAHVLEGTVHKRSRLSDNSSTEEEMGVEKLKCSTESVPKKQLGSVSSVGETELSAPEHGLPVTSKDQNEKGRGNGVEFFGSSSKVGMEGMENSYEMLDLNSVPICVSKVSSISDNQSSTLQPPLTADHIVSDEAQKRNPASDNYFTEDTLRMKRLFKLSSDCEYSSYIPALHGSSTVQHEKGWREENEESECTSTESKEARDNTESCTTVGLKLSAENYNSPACDNEPVLSPVTPALQLFPEDAEVEAGTELGICRSLQLVSTEFSLSRPQYVRDRNTWIPKSVKERLQRDGCGDELRLSIDS